jgi:predicted DNA-binding protein
MPGASRSRGAAMNRPFDHGVTAAVTDDPGQHLSPPETDAPMISRSLRLPVDLDRQLREHARARGLGSATLMRQLIEAGLAELDDTVVVPLADVRRVLAELARRHQAA